MIDASFYALNAVRSYPVEDGASGLDDSGSPLPPGIVVDCSIRFLDDEGAYARISAVTASPTLCTVAIEGCRRPARFDSLAGAAPASPFRPLASISVAAPFPIHEPIPVTALEAGVVGWIVLGPGASSPYSGVFSTSEQSGLLPRCARGVRRPGVRSLDSATGSGMVGTVALLGGSDVVVVPDSAVVEGVLRSVVRFGLKSATETNRELLAAYAGPCGSRPESGTCDPPAVESLGGAVPDEFGNVDVVFSPEFSGLTILPLSGATGGLVVDLPRTLADVCPPAGTTFLDELQETATECDVLPPASGDWGLTVVTGVVGTGDDGVTVVSGEPAIVLLPASEEPNRVTVVFDAAPAAGTPGMAAGPVFNWLVDPVTHDTVYRAAVLDLYAGTLTSYLVVLGGATVVEAVASLDFEGSPSQLAGTEAKVVVTLGDRRPDGSCSVSVQGLYKFGGAFLSYSIASRDGGFGMMADGPGVVFKSFKLEKV